METIDFVTQDLSFVVSLSDKYGIRPPSWYWRLHPETEQEWIQRRVILSNERDECQGLICINDANTSISYALPTSFEEDTLVQVSVQKGQQLEELSIPYKDLYDNLTEMVETIVGGQHVDCV